jgi:IclR family transcriptional regulator, KDG regulon repressor
MFRSEKHCFVYYTAVAKKRTAASVRVRAQARAQARAPARQARVDGGDGLQSLQAAFRILDELSSADGPVGLTDLASRLDELKPRVYRHLSTMKSLGIVIQDSRNGRYGLGGKLFALGEAALEQFDLGSVAAPYLTRLRDQTRQTALLSVPANGEPIVLSCVEYRDRLSITSRPGNRPPPHCSSQGRIALAFADLAARKRVLGRKLSAFTSYSMTNREAIEERLGLIRERYYEEANHEVRLGINALSAPVFRDDDQLAGIIGVIGTSEEIGTPPSRPLITTLHRLAGALSAELNCRIYYEKNLVK